MCILFVEDEFLISMDAEDALREAGHEVLTAPHATAAIGLMAEHPGRFTCLVTDVNMPGDLTGLELTAHVRERYPEMPIVVATSNPAIAPPEWRERQRAAVLGKPYTPKLLVGTVERLLNAAGRRR